MGSSETEPLLLMRGIVKQFPGVRALDGVDLDVRPGEVHCLLGQNGAGKSTLIKVLAGAHQPDEGEIVLGGRPVRLTGPNAAMRAGIATIYQELDLVDGLSVAENIFLGHEKSTLGFTRRGDAERAARELLGRLGHREIPPRREVGRLPAAGKQVVSMARALSHDARLIVMDEPSAALAHDEVGNLFRIIRELTAAGVAVVYISHRLEEIREIGDRVTVLKDGRTVAVGLPVDDTPTDRLISLMTGRVRPSTRSTSGPSAGRAVRRSWRRSTAGTVPRPDGCCWRGARSGPAAPRRRYGAGWGWPPRSARARRCCWTSPSPPTSPWPP